jgi:hypothetical protein
MRLPNALWYFVVLIAILLFAVLIPAFRYAKAYAYQILCGDNIKALTVAMSVYMKDHDEQYPTPQQWCDLLINEVEISPLCFRCSFDPKGAFSFAVNENLYKTKPGLANPQMVAIFEANLGRNGVGGPDDLVLRHNQRGQLGCLIAFADGHTEFVTEDRITDLEWRLE